MKRLYVVVGSGGKNKSRCKIEKVSFFSEKNMSSMAMGTGSGPFTYIIFPVSLMTYDI